jgi:hypothetical protein
VVGRASLWDFEDDAMGVTKYSVVPPVEPRKKQVGGTHYADMPVQPWDVMRSCFSKEGFACFLQGNVIKYVMRSNAKNGIEDLKKAQHYLEELVNLLESK